LPYNQLLAIQQAAQGIPLGNLAQLEHQFADHQLGGTGTKQGGRKHSANVAGTAGMGLDE
jgi:hypothetical protein